MTWQLINFSYFFTEKSNKFMTEDENGEKHFKFSMEMDF